MRKSPPKTRRSDASRPAGRGPSDARPLDGARRRPNEPDPDVELRLKLRRRAARLLFYVVFIAGAIAALVGERGLVDLVRLSNERDRVRVELEEQRAKVAEHRRAVEELKGDSMAKERIAREQLGLVRPGETVFLLPKEDRGVVPEQDPPVVEGEAGEEPSRSPSGE
jgi:cell division protein FtsB